jgi:uncharacterized protein YkwD
MFNAWLRVVGLVVVIGVGLLAGTAHAAPTKHANQAVADTALESGVLAEVNALRRSRGLTPLRLSSALSAAALQHSEEMGTQGFFGHDSADGSAFWKRVQRFYPSARRGYWSVGENLLWSSPDVDPAGALKMWMDSPPHRENLLTARWREIGISAVHVAAAPGTFRELDVTIVAAEFGVRR